MKIQEYIRARWLLLSCLSPIFVGAFLTACVISIDVALPAMANEDITRNFHLDYFCISPGTDPVSFPGVNVRPSRYSLAFFGLARDDNYDNFFQTGNKDSVQLELQHPGQLFLKIGDAFVFKVSNNVELNRWYKYELKGSVGNFVRFYIDNALVLETTRAEVVSQQLDFSNIKFGTGYGDQRRLQGELKDLTFDVSGITSPVWLRSILCAFGFGCALILVVFFLRTTNGSRFLENFIESIGFGGPQVGLLGIFLVVSGGAIWLIGIGVLHAKWAILAAMGIAIGASPFVELKTVSQIKYMRVPLTFLSLGCIGFLGLILWRNPRIIDQVKDAQIVLTATISVMAFSFLTFIFFRFRKRCKFKALGLIQVFIFLNLLIVCCLALADLQSWQLLAAMPASQPAMGTFLAIFGTGLALYLPFKVRDEVGEGLNFKVGYPVAIQAFLVAIPYVIFAVLSSRSDMLFIDSSQFHWEYYVGVIRSIRNGGWLLADTPSQYGFMPFLLAALLPVKSSWNAFFILHTASLLAVSILFYQGALIICRLSRLLAAALVIATVFFAYPGLISPTPYPSSGPMRFLWCYVLLFWSGFIFTGSNQSPYRFAKVGAFLWIAGVLWSAESAVYCTAIYFSPIGLALVSIMSSRSSSYLEGRSRIGAMLGLLGQAFCCASVTVIGISAFYFCFLGVLPDWSMHFNYAFAYASGFGGMDIPFNGPIWLIVLLLLVGFIAISINSQSGSKDSGRAMLAVSATACIWSIASYYLGRSVPNNIVAFYPVLAFSLLVLLRSWPRGANASILIAISTPFFVLALMSPLANKGLIGHLAGMQVLSFSVDDKTAVADNELIGLMNEARLSPESLVAYYGYDVAMPRSIERPQGENFEKTWLPNPLQLLEEPIPEQKQREIIKRWSSRRTGGGYMVQKKGQAEDRFAHWLQLLDENYILVKMWESPSYRILLFSRKKI